VRRAASTRSAMLLMGEPASVTSTYWYNGALGAGANPDRIVGTSGVEHGVDDDGPLAGHEQRVAAGADLATKSAPMPPFRAGRFSTTNGCFSRRRASGRASGQRMSALPPRRREPRGAPPGGIVLRRRRGGHDDRKAQALRNGFS